MRLLLLMTETSSGRANQERIGHLRAICFSFLLFQVLAAAAGVLHPPAVGAVHAVRQLHHPETPQEASQEKNGRLGTHLGQQKNSPKQLLALLDSSLWEGWCWEDSPMSSGSLCSSLRALLCLKPLENPAATYGCVIPAAPCAALSYTREEKNGK